MAERNSPKQQPRDIALHAYNVLVRLEVTLEERIWLLQHLHERVGRTVPDERMAREMLLLGEVRSLRTLRQVSRLGRRRIANLRAALSRYILPEHLGELLQTMTTMAPDVPEVVFPHPLGPDADFEPLVARRLLMESAVVQGSPVELPGFPLSHPRIHGFRTALKGPMPASVVIVGGGYVGVEIAMAWAARGCRVSIIEEKRQLLAGYIPSFSQTIQADVLAAGIGVRLEAEAVGWAERTGHIIIYADTWDGVVSLWADMLLVAIGVREDAPEAISPATGPSLLPSAD